MADSPLAKLEDGIPTPLQASHSGEEEHTALVSGSFHDSLHDTLEDSDGGHILDEVPIEGILFQGCLSTKCLGNHHPSSTLVNLVETSSEYILDEQEAHQVLVRNPEKHGEGFKDAYVSYEISTKFVDGKSCRVRRRYQDFIWLVSKLSEEIEAGVIPPPIPEKQRLDYMDRFSPSFIKKRQQSLERFLKRTLLHPKLSNHPTLISFLTQPILGIDETEIEKGLPSQMDSPSGMAAVVEKLSDAVINVFSANRQVDEKFLVMKKTAGLLEAHFDKLAGIYGKLVSSSRGLSEAMVASASILASTSTHFGRLERLIEQFGPHTSVDAEPSSCIPLRTLIGDYGQLMEERSTVSASLSDDTELKIHLLLCELAQYCRVVRYSLRLRDQKQFEWQDLLDHLQEYRQEHAQLLGEPSQAEGDSSLTASDRLRASKSAVVSFLAEKIDSLRGVDSITSRTERIKKLETRIAEIEVALCSSKELSSTVDSTIEREYHGFLSMVNRELIGSLFPEMAFTWNQFHHHELSIWNTFIQDSLEESL